MNWDDMKIFLAIAQARGLKKAAEKLDIHHTSCARRIKVLEQELGTRLFDRLPSGYALTQAGENLLLSAQNIQEEFAAIESNLLGKDTRLEGSIRITIPNGFATHLLMPDLTAFMELYPDVQVEVNMTYMYRDLANREADVAIRHANNPPESLAGKRVGRLYFSAYASTEYLRSHDPVKHPEQCHWLGWGPESNHLKWAQKNKYPSIPVRGNLFSDVLQLSAVTEGMGIASLPCFIGDKAPGIQRIPNAEAEARDWIWILAHKDMATNAKVRVFMDYMSTAFANRAPTLKGVI